ncbi:hypothetical protein Y032_0640g1009 [Ancylostoma ceylanicum]|uniref:Uncharacterized protein n=1 Tax=Ancylostoma ceylanicum TaxID=53326 RepID=A0A016WJL3_9BILA|nr:hypothetical protein Y032_0640g1009 [Ancylostoma ceylanicum]
MTNISQTILHCSHRTQQEPPLSRKRVNTVKQREKHRHSRAILRKRARNSSYRVTTAKICHAASQDTYPAEMLSAIPPPPRAIAKAMAGIRQYRMGTERLAPKPKRRRVRPQLEKSTDLSSDDDLSQDAPIWKNAPVSETTSATTTTTSTTSTSSCGTGRTT